MTYSNGFKRVNPPTFPAVSQQLDTVFMSDKLSPQHHLVDLLARIISRRISGCLKLSSRSISWFIYLDAGKLFYASNSSTPFERIEQHLKKLDVPASNLEVMTQYLHLLLEESLEIEGQSHHADTHSDSTFYSSDYQSICWLVDNQHLSTAQAISLIKNITRSVMIDFLSIQGGSYELIRSDKFDKLPKFCHLDLSSLIKYSQNQLQPPQDLQLVVDPLEKPTLQQLKEIRSSEVTPAFDQKNGSSSITSIPTSKTADRYTIACIDDSPASLQAINSYLDNKLFSVLMINNPINALMQIIRHKPDLILLDVTMPQVDGYELCSLLRRHPNFKKTPVIMVTGNTGLLDRARAKLVGASGYLTKPFTRSDLIKSIFKHLS
jgi:twitching motility two-component system response regulator PilG